MKIKLLLIILFIIAVSSCKKDTEIKTKPFNHSKLNSSLYPFLFDVGSYWIYRDTSSNQIDSTILANISKSTFLMSPSAPGEGPQGDVEYFNINYFSFLNNESYDEQLLGYVISRGLYNGGFTLLSSKKIGDKSLNAEIINVFDSLKIEGNTYKKVVKMKITKDSYIDNNYNFYYVDSIGVIRKETTINDSIIKTWNLLRCKINMFDYQ
jgi:hypothetical protein